MEGKTFALIIGIFLLVVGGTALFIAENPAQALTVGLVIGFFSVLRLSPPWLS
jgi:hypothetical protein